MRILIDQHLTIGMMPCCRKPPQFEASFFVKGTFTLAAGKPAAFAEEPEFVTGDVYPDDDPAKGLRYPSDFSPFKPRADVVIVGSACAPDGKPVTTLFPAIRVGKLAKSVKVFGPRTMRGGLFGPATTEPEPFVKVPLTWENAFGGPGYGRNPAGAGRASDRAPNIEYANRPITGARDNADPAGFGPVDRSWDQRQALVGTYRGNWLKERWPWFPDDFDWGYFNAAPRDQQVDGYLRGDEELEFQDMNPQVALLRTRLPGFRVRCFLNERLADGQLRYRELPLVLDTLWADLDALKLILVWRGVAAVRTFKFKEIEDVQVVTEPLAAKPFGADFYHARLLPVAVAALVPEPPVAAGVDRAMAELELEMAQLDKEKALMDKEMAAVEAEAERVFAEGQANLQAGGFKIDIQKMENGPAPSAAEVSAHIAAVIAQLKATPGHAGTAELVAELEKANIGGELAKMEKEMGALQTDLEKMAAEPFDMGPKSAHESVAAAAAQGESLADQDLRELDLSGLDLTKSDLSGAVLAKTNLSGTRLSNAKLKGAILTGANLAKADLAGADLTDADLTGAKLPEAKLTGLTLARTTLTGLDLTAADLTGASGKEANFARTKLTGALLAGVKLPQANFTGADLSRAILAGAQLPSAIMREAKAPGLNCEGADLTALQASEGSDFTGGNFRGIRGDGAIFEQSTLDGADFSRSLLGRSQFTEALLRGARFDRANLAGAAFDDAVLTQAVFTHANLLQAAFERADLSEANLEGANGFEAGFWLTVTAKANLRDANLRRTLLG